MAQPVDTQPASVIEFLQAIAIVMVVLAHGLMLALPSYPGLLLPFTLLSIFGIDLLLLVAGFLAGAQLIDFLQSRLSLLDFWRSRWRQTLPSYYLFLALSCVLYPLLFKIPLGGWSYLWFGQSLFSPASNGFFPEAWRLAIEQWFFLLTPLLLLAMAQRLRDRSAAILWFCALVLLLMPLLRIAYICSVHPAWDSGLRKITFLRFDALAWGVLFAYWKLCGAQSWERHVYKLTCIGIVFLLLCGMYVGNLVKRGAVPLNTLPDAVFIACFFTFLSAGLACLLPVLSKLHLSRGTLLNDAISALSRWSYSLYLVHIPLLYTLLFFVRDSLKNRPFVILIAGVLWLILSIAIAAVCFRFFEQPASRLGTVRIDASGARRP